MTALIDPSKHNQRARITATLHCLAPLHIGDGGVESFANRKQGQTLGKAARAATKDDSFYSTVCRDHAGRPILPGSSLRGLLRQATAQIDADRLEALFGPEAGEDKLSMGRVIVCDAPMSMGPAETQHLADFVTLAAAGQRERTGAGTCIAHNVSIDAITGAAAAVEHLLFAEEYVPAGSEFTLVLELGPCDDSDLGTILAVLNGFDGKAGHSLGAGASHGFGQFLVPASSIKVQARNRADLLAWLQDGVDTPAPCKCRTDSLPTHGQREAAPSIQIDLHFDGAFAINDPGLIGRADANAEHAPDIEFSRDSQGRPRIPGRSLRGLIRHRARRIIATVLHQKHGFTPREATRRAETLVQEIFGDTERQSPLRIGEARVVEGGRHDGREQTFNAVDRFTGGVADSKLYTAHLAQPTTLRFSLSLRRGQPEPWWLGLGLLILRDAVEGDLAIGWGKGKGLGAFHAGFAGKTDWTEVLHKLEELCVAHKVEQKPEQWHKAFHDHLITVAKDSLGEETETEHGVNQ